MKLADMTVTAYADLLASDAPAPGGGSAAALSGAQGIGLTAMVCALTVGKKKYEDHQELAIATQARALALKDKFVDIIDRDTEAFNAVGAAFAMAKETDEEKAARSAAIQAAFQGCTKTPMEMMEFSIEGLQLTKAVLGKSNTNAASDLGVAALSLKAAVQGAWLNVLINLGSIKDEAFVADYRAKGEAILAEALPMADEIYTAVLESL